jgi:integrase
MPQRLKPPRLWLRPAQRNKQGAVTRPEFYVILDNGKQISTGTDDMTVAEKALAAHVTSKHHRSISSGRRDIEYIAVADVITLYVDNVVGNHADKRATKHRLKRVVKFFARKTLADINGQLCRDYIKQSSTDAMARRDLEDLRAAINHHRQEGLHDRIVSVVLPERRPPRERWLERSEAARLVWTAWRRPKCKQVARFVLVALYTGRRASVVCRASFEREPGRPWIDTRRGYLWPPERAKQTKKRNPPIPLPPSLLAHLRRWERHGGRYVIGWGDHSVGRVDRTVKLIAAEAGLEPLTPHALRHSAATWLMQAGVDLWEAGRYLGMTVRTLEGTYGHHRPQHLSGAKDAFAKMPRQRFVNASREPRANTRDRKDTGNRDLTRYRAPA